jgi:hypothetical protein
VVLAGLQRLDEKLEILEHGLRRPAPCLRIAARGRPARRRRAGRARSELPRHGRQAVHASVMGGSEHVVASWASRTASGLCASSREQKR